MPAGRPSKYKSEFCDRVIELGKEGKSYAQIAAALGVARDTIYDWQEKFPEFSYAMKNAREASLAWWEDQGQKNLEASSFQSSTYKFFMERRFPKEYGTDDRKGSINLNISGILASLVEDKKDLLPEPESFDTLDAEYEIVKD